MKTLRIITILYLLTIVLATSAHAQTDYVITAKGDSIPCKISMPFFGGIKYKDDAMSEPKKIKPEEIKQYFIARKNLLERSVQTDSTLKPVFMTVIEKGKINIYESIIYSGDTQIAIWYISKDSDEVIALKTSGLSLSKPRRTRKDILAKMLMDNKAVYNKYKADDKFTFKQIRKLVHWYDTGHPLTSH